MLTDKFWNKYFSVYDVLNKSIPYSDLLKSLINSLDLDGSTDLKVLDLGAGTGNLSTLIYKVHGIRPVALDYSEAGMSIHRTKDEQAQLVKHDLNNKLPFADSTYDRVVSNNTLYTFTEEKQLEIIKEVRRVLKPGGIFVVSNIAVGFRPIQVLSEHIKQDIDRRNFLVVLADVIRLLVPTVKMFYYNWLIKREHGTGGYYFVSEDGQRELLIKAGFRDVTQGVRLYANQAIMNKAIK